MLSAMADSLSEEVRAFLVEGTRTGKLGTLTGSGWPHVMPIWFVLDDDELVFSTGRDTVKGRYIRRDDRVSLCVDDERHTRTSTSGAGRASTTIQISWNGPRASPSVTSARIRRRPTGAATRSRPSCSYECGRSG
jgi:hypothetical protein